LVLAGFGLAVLFTFMVAGEAAQGFAPFVIMVALFLFLWGAGGMVVGIWPTLGLLGGQGGSTRGEGAQVTRVTHGRYTNTYYYYSIEGRNWLVSPEAYRALLEGRRYRLYYLPRSKKLVGIEPIEE